MATKKRTPKEEFSGEDVVFSCTDWSERLDRGEFPLDIDRYLPYLNETRADQVIKIASRLRLVDVPGQPLRDCEQYFPEWQKNVFRIAAGGLQPDGSQRVKTLMVCVSKKNDKSSGSASLMLSLTMMSPRPNAEMLIVGPTQSISDISFKQVVNILQADAELSKLWKVQMHLKRCTFIPNNCTLSVKTMDAQILVGTKAAVVLVDEGHMLSGTEHARIMTQIKGAGAAIKEQQTIIISTMSDQPSSGWWKQELEIARSVRANTSNVPNYVPLIWEPSPDQMKSIESVCQPEVWARCNPNLGRSVSMEWLKQSFKSVLATGDETELKRWLSQFSNCEISSILGSENSWTGIPFWSRNGNREVTEEWIIANCERIALGFDGGSSFDLSSLCIAGLDNNDSTKMYVAVRSWCYQELLDQDRGQLGDAVKNGDLKVIVPGEEVEEIVQLTSRLYNTLLDQFLGIGCDPNGIASELSQALLANDLPQEKVIAIAQGYSIRSGWLGMYRKLCSGNLIHGDQPLVNWAISNCIENKAGYCAKKDAISKIDPAVAIACATMLCLNPPAIFDINAMIAFAPAPNMPLGGGGY